jgi:NADH-quinone oxidoreductase subunit M
LALSRLVLPRTAAWLCFGGFALAFVIKVPMFPLHTWLPDAHVQAPTGGSIILAAVLLKLGTYGYIRFCMGMFAGVAWTAGANLAGVAIAGGILYGALVAWKQDDVKRLVAYSSVAHMGFVMLGLFAATRAGVEGAILQMINHGISTGALFLLVGVIYDRRHTRQLREFGGLAKVMPRYTVLFWVALFASIGLPGLNGFIGEYLILQGAMSAGFWYAFGGAVGIILGAIYMLRMFRTAMYGEVTRDENRNLSDIGGRETFVLALVLALIVWIGVQPQPFLKIIGADAKPAMIGSQLVQNPPAANTSANMSLPDVSTQDALAQSSELR